MSTHNIGFYEDFTKIIFHLLSNIVKYAPYFFCWICTGVNQKVLPVLSTETLLHIWLSTEYYVRPSSTAVDTVSLHVLDPTVPRKRMQMGF